MAKIVHVANFGRRPKGAFQHSVGHKISNGLTRNGHSVAQFSDRDVARAGSWIGHRKFGVKAANSELRDFCRAIEPEIMVLHHADVIRPETVASIRGDFPHLRVVQCNVDPMFEPDNVRRITSKLDVVDATLVTTAGDALAPLSRPDRLLGFLPNPVDFSIETGRNHDRANLPFDLFCACGNARQTRNTCGGDWYPDSLIDVLEQGAPGLRMLLPGLRGASNIAGAEYQKGLESAAMGLNLSRRNDFVLYSSDRIAQMAGNGMAILIDRATGYNQLFSEDEFAFFSTIDELVDQIGRMVRDPAGRQARASAGRSRYHALFNEQIVARYVVDVALGKLRESDYPWPTLFSHAAVAA